MKKHFKLTLLAVLLITLASLSSSAQYRPFVLGIKVAPSISWLGTNTQTYDNEGARFGFAWGVTSEYYFARNYAIATGLNFLYQGGKISYPDAQTRDGNIVEGLLIRKFRINYLEIPAVLKLKTNDIGMFRYFGQIGLGFGIRTKSKASDIFETGIEQIMTDYHEIDGQTRLFKPSMIVGVGIEYPFDNNTALIGSINLNNGLSNVLKGQNSITSSIDHEARANFIEVSVGVNF